MTNAYRQHLASYLERQRWFSGKGRDFAVTHIHAMPWLSEADPRLRIEVVTVTYSDGTTDSYQFPTAYLDVADPDLAHALVGECEHPELGKVAAYDACFLKPAAEVLFTGFLQPGGSGLPDFHVVENAVLPTEALPGFVMTAEQSNTSIAYGDEAILKLFRRLSAGGNPDIEIHNALTLHGEEHIAPLLGWVEGRWSDAHGGTHHGDLAMLQVFLRTATDGWDLALASVRDLLVEEDLHPAEVGGDFAGEASRLGEATAAVHADLATVFPAMTATPTELAETSASMHARLDHAVTVVPELEAHREALAARFDAITRLGEPVHMQRVHGDFHLGQTLRTVKGWKLIDFEGEPAKPLHERARADSPLRDVAGMLRSFDYAAGATLHQFGDTVHLAYRAHEWTQRNRAAFLDGYSTAGGTDVSQHQVLLSAYEADKAVYEAVYEARNRPAWLEIPLQAIERLTAEE
ncbi:MAG: maltokinase N-terminal cap-like domain-containing protein [Nocardioidaceae bacterium]